MAQAILADTFPPDQRGLAFALYGITVIVAPTVGPTLGGWITDNYTWRWIFFINLPVGILALFLVYRLIEDPPWAKRVQGALARFDYIGVSLLVLGVGALQIMLDKGQEDDWFGSHFILTLAILAVVGLVSLVIWEWFYKNPIIDVRLFKNLNFLSANGMMFVLGHHAVLQPGHDASVPAIADGLHGGVGGPGAFRAAASAADSDADRGVALLQGPGALPGRVWLADAFDRHVLFHPAARPANQLSERQHAAPACRCLAWVFCSSPSI